MNHSEKRATYAIAGIFSFRMLGLFMILPVFAPYGQKLLGSTPFLMGVALGIYGLGQAVLQIPFGMLSDKIGRKPVILFGLVLFAIGSLIAAMSPSIVGVIIGRLLQGAGAIGSTCTAFVADTTNDENRSKAMALIGMVIATSFFLAMIFGPLFASWIGVSGLFYLTAFFAVCGMLLTLLVPKPKKLQFHADSEMDLSFLNSILKNKALLRLDLGIFVSHAILTATFVSLPLILLQYAHLDVSKQWLVYLPALTVAYVAIFPMIIISEVKRCLKQALLIAVFVLALSQLGLWAFHTSALSIGICLFFFFTMFSFLEATIPSLVSKIAPAKNRGTAIGVYSTCQFLGIFFGGLFGGYFTSHHELTAVFLFSAVLAGIWLIIAATMKHPPYLSRKILPIRAIETSQTAELQAKLLTVPGVKEVALMPKEEAAYLKVDKKLLDEEALANVIKSI